MNLKLLPHQARTTIAKIRSKHFVATRYASDLEYLDDWFPMAANRLRIRSLKPSGGIFHGVRPQSATLSVTTEDGKLLATLQACFKLPSWLCRPKIGSNAHIFMGTNRVLWIAIRHQNISAKPMIRATGR